LAAEAKSNKPLEASGVFMATDMLYISSNLAFNALMWNAEWKINFVQKSKIWRFFLCASFFLCIVISFGHTCRLYRGVAIIVVCYKNNNNKIIWSNK
jgi:hypothetical protein